MSQRCVGMILSAVFLVGGAAGVEGRSAPGVHSPSAREVSCEMELPGPHSCYRIPVPEAREEGGDRILELFVVVGEATSEEGAGDAVFFLTGGPGQGASGLAPMLLPYMSAIREDRDIVLVDQRGTGRSNPLRCPPLGDPEDADTYLREFLDPVRYRACLPDLRERADLTQYTTVNIADDVDDVRRALGYESMTLLGGSYGTRVGLEILRRHPDRVRAALLEGVAARFHRHLADAPALLDRGVEQIQALCAADVDCAERHPRFAERLEGLLARLGEGPIETTMRNPMTGREEDVSLTYEAFVYALRFSLYGEATAADLPRHVEAAHRGDWSPFLRMALGLTRSFGVEMANGMNVSVRCAEVVPFTDFEAARERAKGTIFGDLRLRQEFEICDFWPRGTVPEGYTDPVRSDVPTLLLGGELDPTSPPEEGRFAARHLSQGRFVEMPNVRHDVGSVGECILDVRTEFVRRGHWRGMDLSCLRGAQPPSFND